MVDIKLFFPCNAKFAKKMRTKQITKSFRRDESIAFTNYKLYRDLIIDTRILYVDFFSNSMYKNIKNC